MHLRIDPDTKDALLFVVGLGGIISQAVLAALGTEPSVPLLGTFTAMCGIALAPRKGQNDDDAEDTPDAAESEPAARPAARRRRRAK